ncbi:class I SAM-dependent methyltransferase [Cellulomonas fengjieae]|uniref:class I SAM-dependent methyltransferase n=1 Tax=Cellulomonas fengjieae TaxID=2819978 RepID=UPI001AAF66E6|nr:class I SAM-dependent methyltransferase [Cellulomonas fengjieae]MBO3100437.1 class I SAM-dependent methyltransferase [Cellulomonas fengjieae]
MTDPANFYTGLVVQAYSALKAQTFDPAPYAAFVRSHGQPGLEVGCGAGQPLLELVSKGLDVDGVDSSPDMIEQARTAARQQGLDVRLHVARMEQMDLGRQYRSIYLAGPTFQLLPDDEVALRALEAFRRHLAPGGTLMVPLWVAGPTPAEQLGAAREAVDDSGAVLRYTPVSEVYDPATRTRRTAVTYERVPTTGPRERVDRDWVIHWQTLRTITELASQAGLTVRNVEPPSAAGDADLGAEFTVFLTHA